MFRFFYLSLHVAVRSFTTTILQIIDVFVKPRCSRDVIFHLFKRCHCSNHKLANLLKYKDPLHVVGRKLVTLFPVMFLLLFCLLFGCTLTILILDYETKAECPLNDRSICYISGSCRISTCCLCLIVLFWLIGLK